ncbi:MAG: HlyD family efflux transporter periplasmic adaptor subunit [Planctomycetota bacterium]
MKDEDHAGDGTHRTRQGRRRSRPLGEFGARPVSGRHGRNLPAAALVVVIGFAGCGSGGDDEVAETKRPRPVAVEMLTARPTPQGGRVAASVASWKTEDLGFEVGGRVEWVAEKNVLVRGRVETADGELIQEGDPIARIDDEAYRLAFESAKAELARSEQSVVATKIDLEKGVPARLRAAEADLRLAEYDVSRVRRLAAQNAATQADLDEYEAKLETASAEVERIKAEQATTEADLVAAKLAVLQAEQARRDAERDLENCVLYSSFDGQIADTFEVPGSVVANGTPIVTLQMMNPIKIEFEVSAEKSRELADRQVLPVYITSPKEGLVRDQGLVFTIDQVADTSLRTFTVTLLVTNPALTDSDAAGGPNVPTVERAWRTDLDFLPGAKPGDAYVVDKAIRSDASGEYVFKIDSIAQGEPLPADKRLSVSRVAVAPTGTPVPFLGDLFFQKVGFPDADFDPTTQLLAGALTFAGGDASGWDGQTVRLERPGRFLVRPGDLVSVDVSRPDDSQGLLVPMNAISFADGKTYLFLVAGPPDAPVAERVEVVMADGGGPTVSTLRRVLPAGDGPLAGRQYVSQGAHYLLDGESITPVAAASEAGR